MDPKFTKGPWKYVEPEMLSHDAPGFTAKLSSGGIMGGTLDDPQWVIADADYVESEADIHLIAAAPDLYDQLALLSMAVAVVLVDAASGEKKVDTELLTVRLNMANAALKKARAE